MLVIFVFSLVVAATSTSVTVAIVILVVVVVIAPVIVYLVYNVSPTHVNSLVSFIGFKALSNGLLWETVFC